jgi:hypothetical protein
VGPVVLEISEVDGSVGEALITLACFVVKAELALINGI